MATRTPRTPRKNRKTTGERAELVKRLRERLEEWEGDADEETIAAALARHDGYSDRNSMLIAMQDPEATDCRGYRAWQDAGRQVGRYPEDQGGIVILSFRGDNAPKEGDAPKEATPAKPGEGEQTAEKISRFFSPATVHDVRWTHPLFCGDCGLPIHRTGYDAEAKRHLWTHTDVAKADHPARQPRRDETPPVPAAVTP